MHQAVCQSFGSFVSIQQQSTHYNLGLASSLELRLLIYPLPVSSPVTTKRTSLDLLDEQ